MTYQVVYATLIIFGAGLLLTVATRNILKIFIGILISYSAAIMLVFISSNPYAILNSAILSAIAPFICFLFMFIIAKINKKFNTLEIKKKKKIIKEEEND